MSLTETASTADTMDSFIADIGESLTSDGPGAGLQSATGDHEVNQSGETEDQVAPDSADEQPVDTDETETSAENVAATTSDAELPVSAAPSWDSPENPYFQQMETLRQAVAQAQAEQQQKEAHERFVALGKDLSSADEEDIPLLMDGLVQEITSTAIAPANARIAELEHGFTSTVAAAEMILQDTDGLKALLKLTPEARLARLRETSAEFRTTGSDKSAVEAAFAARQAESQRTAQMRSGYETELKNLRAQLAAKTITDSGANRGESVAVGNGGADDVSWDSLLGGLR